MNIISIENLNKSYGEKVLFKDLSLGINEGEKIGLIGRNGEGKTTLLKIISGQEKEDSGLITKNRNLRIEYLSQNVNFKEDLTVLEQVFMGNNKLLGLFSDYNTLIKSGDYKDEELILLTEKMDKYNAWELESKAKLVLNKLGIENINEKISNLSGGKKKRVSLASVLINDSDLLILDEPTNHLDNESIDYLEEYLLEYKGAILMVTHDRYFLDRVSNRIIELDNKQIYSYSGNYNYFLTKKMEREEKDIASERKRKSLYRQELEWMKQGVKARGTRQKARVERFNDLKNSKLDINDEEIEINVGGKRLGKKIVEIDNIYKSFGEKQVIKDFSYTILRDDRIGIVGDNGSGKSTLMNIISGNIEADKGMVDIGETVKIGYFSQEIKNMDENLRAIEYIKEGGEFIKTSTDDKITATDMMELFLFDSNEQYSVISTLSGGERRRLFLLRVLMEGPNFLILDEPTNDLDIQTITILEEYIESFPGPVIVVSHDRYFLNKVTNSTFHIENAEIKMYPGNYSYYKKMHIDSNNIENETIKNKEIIEEFNIEDNKNRTLKFSYNEKREFETIDMEIKKIEEDLKKVEKDIELNAANYVKLEELLVEKEELEEKLEFKMERWLYLTELNEEIENK